MKNLLETIPPYYRIKTIFKRPNIETVTEFLLLLDSYEQKYQNSEYDWYNIEDQAKSVTKIYSLEFLEKIVTRNILEGKFRLPNWFTNRVIKYCVSPVTLKRLDENTLSTLKKVKFDKISYSITFPTDYDISECEYIWTTNIDEFYLELTNDELNPYLVKDKFPVPMLSSFGSPIRGEIYDNFLLDIIIRKMLENDVEIKG